MSNPELITVEEAWYLRDTIADSVESAYEETIQSDAKQSAYDHYNFVSNLLTKMDSLINTVEAREAGLIPGLEYE